MRSSTKLLNLALVGVILSLIGSSGWHTSTRAQQPQQPPDICKDKQSSVIVDSVQKLQDAINDLDCTEIIVQGGIYEVNLAIFRRDNLTIKSLAGDRKRPTITGPLPDRQTITIANSSNVTIQGLIIAQQKGNVGILVSESRDIKLIDNIIHGYPEAGISIANSQQVSLDGNQIGGSFDSDTARTRVNAVGVRIANSTVSMADNRISNNDQDGIEITNSTVTLERSTISRNKGCGVKADPQSTVRTSSDDNRNWIFRNTGGNTCPWELSRAIRRAEILVPDHFDFTELGEAIKDAEPVRGEDDRPYLVLLQQQGEYMKNLCLDRSIKIEAKQPVRIKSITIGTQGCPLHKEEKGNTDKEAGDIAPSIRVYMSGITVGPVSPSSDDSAIQIGTAHSDSAQKTFLKVKLQDITAENSKTGLKISPLDKEHKLDIQIHGTRLLQDTVCTGKGYPPPAETSSLSSIRNNQEGIRLENPKQAELSVQVKYVEIKGNTNYGILYEVGGNTKLSLEYSRVTGNGQGIGVTDKGRTDPQALAELTVQLARIWQNNKGGVKIELKSTARPQLKSLLIDVDIRKNTGFGVYIEGNAETTLKASSDIPISSSEQPHNCEISDNFGPGVRAHGSAVVTIENMFVNGNGYRDEGKTQPVPRPPEPGASKVGPDGIFASDSVQLTVRNTYVGPNNAGVGIALQASNKDNKLKATLNDNYIESNRKWGVSYIIRSCLAEMVPDNFYDGQVEGQNNVLVGNGFRLSKAEEAAGPDQGLGRGQVCPKELDSLIMRVQ